MRRRLLLPCGLGVALLAIAGPARADVLFSPCDADHFERYLGERCLTCEASEYEPERCRLAYAGKGLAQRCTGMPLDSTRGSSIWGELWCLPRGDNESPLPEALPILERVAGPGDPSPGLPPIPEGFRDTAPLPPEGAPEAPSPAEPEPPAASEPARPRAAEAPARAAGCGGCRVDERGLGWAILGIVAIGLARRRDGDPADR